MKWVPFHHPDVSFPVVRRRMGKELLELLNVSALFMTRGGWAVVNRHCYPDRKLYREATYRLRKKGLLVKRGDDPTKTPRLELTAAGEADLPVYFQPEKFWNQKWNDIWYLLIYDVPEADRHYRDVLRSFLRRSRLGQLQQSVWVTLRDIRPEFDDLVKGAAVDAFAYLFESRTVLGLANRRVLDDAWNFDGIYAAQSRFLDVTRRNQEILRAGPCSVDELMMLLRLSVDGFHAAFAEDPLLPRALLPRDYQGEKAFAAYRRMMTEIGNEMPVSNT